MGLLLREGREKERGWEGRERRPFWHGWNKLWKTGRAKNFRRKAPEKFVQLPPLFQFAPHLLGHMICCPPVEATYDVTLMSLKATGLQLSVDTLLTSWEICQFSPNFSLTTGSEAIEKLEDKDLFSPRCIEFWRGIRPPCPTACSTPAFW